MGSDIDINVAATFSMKMTPDAEDGHDMSVFLTSGDETIIVAGIDLGAFTISAKRFAAMPGSEAGWRGVLTSSNPLLDTLVVFDTRDGSVEVKATLKLDMGPVVLELSAAANCKSANTVTVGAALVLKAYPEARLTGEYVKFCSATHSAEIDWSADARVQTWKFGSGVSLTDVSASFQMRKQGGLLTTIQVSVAPENSTNSPKTCAKSQSIHPKHALRLNQLTQNMR